MKNPLQQIRTHLQTFIVRTAWSVIQEAFILLMLTATEQTLHFVICSDRRYDLGFVNLNINRMFYSCYVNMYSWCFVFSRCTIHGGIPWSLAASEHHVFYKCWIWTFVLCFHSFCIESVPQSWCSSVWFHLLITPLPQYYNSNKQTCFDLN